jgi:hypothetical protein
MQKARPAGASTMTAIRAPPRRGGAEADQPARRTPEVDLVVVDRARGVDAHLHQPARVPVGPLDGSGIAFAPRRPQYLPPVARGDVRRAVPDGRCDGAGGVQHVDIEMHAGTRLTSTVWRWTYAVPPPGSKLR